MENLKDEEKRNNGSLSDNGSPDMDTLMEELWNLDLEQNKDAAGQNKDDDGEER